MKISWDGDALDVSAILLTQSEVDEFIAALEKAKALLPKTLTMGQQFERSGVEDALRQMKQMNGSGDTV